MNSTVLKIYHFLNAVIAVICFRYPARKLKVIGVTGTDGKTTTVTLIYQILKTAGKKVAMISTVEALIGRERIDTGFHTTTPDPFLLQRLLRKIADRDIEFVVLETTSHGLDQYRVWGCNFYIGVLTNITHEHLDYHKSFSSYRKAKAKLFQEAKISILNKKDESAKKIKNMIPPNRTVVGYPQDLVKKVKTVVDKRFQEPYNRLNAEAAIAVSKLLGIKEPDIIDAIKDFKGVAGRMQEIKNKKGIRVIIDFAHTPNALWQVLTALKKKLRRRKKLIAVFGCAGERDAGKRPMMGKISANLADISIFTAEDPRSEKVEDIIGQMMQGVKNKKAKVYKVPERGEAITFAINEIAKKGDIVVICGKGHEESMAYGNIEYPWSDRKAVKLALIGKSFIIPR